MIVDTRALAVSIAHGRGPVLLSVLPESEHARSHIPGSINVALSRRDFVDRVNELCGDKRTPIVIYCAGADCDAARRAADRLESAGFQAVAEYPDGLEAWRDAGLGHCCDER